MRSLILLVFAGVIPLLAQPNILVTRVTDTQERPIAGLQIGLAGFAASVTDQSGIARVPLQPEIKPGDWVTINISNPSKGWVIVSPWNGRLAMPPLQEQQTYFSVVVAMRGDRSQLENSTSLVTIASLILREATADSLVQSSDASARQRKALSEVSAKLGLKPSEMDRKIRQLGKKATDPYTAGIVALYDRRYTEAARELDQSLQKQEEELKASRQTVYVDSFRLGKSLCETGHYAEASAAFRRADQAIPDEPRLLQAWALNSREQGDYSQAESLLRHALNIERSSQNGSLLYAALLTD